MRWNWFVWIWESFFIAVQSRGSFMCYGTLAVKHRLRWSLKSPEGPCRRYSIAFVDTAFCGAPPRAPPRAPAAGADRRASSIFAAVPQTSFILKTETCIVQYVTWQLSKVLKSSTGLCFDLLKRNIKKRLISVKEWERRDNYSFYCLYSLQFCPL